jgi:hypothetical protein
MNKIGKAFERMIHNDTRVPTVKQACTHYSIAD